MYDMYRPVSVEKNRLMLTTRKKIFIGKVLCFGVEDCLF
jgi:hypothetical protein